MIIFLSSYLGTPDAETSRRMAVARESFEREWSAWPGFWRNPALSFTRDSRDIGDANGVPYVRDMLAQGLAVAQSDDDILFLVNADCSISLNFTTRMTAAVDMVGAVYMRRREFTRIDAPFTDRKQIKEGGLYVGGDGFAFTAGWWKREGEIFPDFVMGRLGWDSGLKNLIRRANGNELWGELAHESHESEWNATPETIEKLPGNVHNLKLLTAWIERWGGSMADHLFQRGELAYK